MFNRNGKVVETKGKRFRNPKGSWGKSWGWIHVEIYEKVGYKWEKNEWGREEDQGKGVEISSTMSPKEENL